MLAAWAAGEQVGAMQKPLLEDRSRGRALRQAQLKLVAVIVNLCLLYAVSIMHAAVTLVRELCMNSSAVGTSRLMHAYGYWSLLLSLGLLDGSCP